MTVSRRLREQVRQQAGDRCGYCLSHQKYVLGWLEIDHLVPQALGGTDDEDNLWLACRLCNSFKGKQTSAIDPSNGEMVLLFNPRTQNWHDHFKWDTSGTLIIGTTPIGRATVVALQLNNPLVVVVRQEWVTAGWHPPG